MAPGRIINFKDDNECRTGIALLIDNASTSQREFDDRGEAKVYTFPFSKKDGGEVTLYCLKMNEFYPMLSSTDGEVGECISHDSYFAVMQFDLKFFQSKQDAVENVKDPVVVAFGKRKKVNVMIITSHAKNSCKMFPLVKEYNEVENKSLKKSNKILNNMRLITDKQNSKDVNLNKSDLENKSNHLTSFSINSQELSQNNNHLKRHFAQVSENQINIYDETQKLKFIFEGLNIRECASVHDSYLYTVSDAIEAPYTVTNYRTGEK